MWSVYGGVYSSEYLLDKLFVVSGRDVYVLIRGREMETQCIRVADCGQVVYKLGYLVTLGHVDSALWDRQRLCSKTINLIS